MIEYFGERANKVIKTMQHSIAGAGTISMAYNIFASGACKGIDDKPCFARIDRNSAMITLASMVVYPLSVSVLNPLLYLGIKKYFNNYSYKSHEDLISSIFSILFKGTFYFVFCMYAVGQLGAPVIENWAAAIAAIGCFVLAVLSDPQIQEWVSSCCPVKNGIFKEILVGLKNFVFAATNVFTVTHGNFSAIQNSLMVVTGNSTHADVYRTIRLSASGTLGIFFGMISAILPSLQNNESAEERSILKKIFMRILEGGNYLFSPVMLLALFFIEISTSILATEDWMKILYPLLVATTLVVLGYAIGRQYFTEDQKCCLEQWIDSDAPSFEEGAIQVMRENEATPLAQSMGADTPITSLLYGNNYSPGIFGNGTPTSVKKAEEVSQQNNSPRISLSSSSD